MGRKPTLQFQLLLPCICMLPPLQRPHKELLNTNFYLTSIQATGSFNSFLVIPRLGTAPFQIYLLLQIHRTLLLLSIFFLKNFGSFWNQLKGHESCLHEPHGLSALFSLAAKTIQPWASLVSLVVTMICDQQFLILSYDSNNFYGRDKPLISKFSSWGPFKQTSGFNVHIISFTTRSPLTERFGVASIPSPCQKRSCSFQVVGKTRSHLGTIFLGPSCKSLTKWALTNMVFKLLAFRRVAEDRAISSSS